MRFAWTMRRAARTDANKVEIVDTFRQMGCYVYDLKQPVDLLVGANNRTMLVEIKDGDKSPSRQKYTKGQAKFLADWKGGPVATVKDAEGARMVARMLWAI
jgi:hypothetical protein